MLKQKVCESTCPSCGNENSDFLEWGEKVFLDSEIMQECTCNSCGCRFKEYYTYKETEWEDPEEGELFEAKVEFLQCEGGNGCETMQYKFRNKAEDFINEHLEQLRKIAIERGELPDEMICDNVILFRTPTLVVDLGIYPRKIQ